ncbi:radical SAM family heme chaperone HemW [Parendozoicomonas sp. Alg238-R29]|uniref:radical SAM family heme chaperone HemW n=1 Tax=Parendozoicomonas sp. Alg238-R29 TaxID=2993446 RepID=UPI00248E0566|nr:radical SAM family heme chaperone HemW [Parendozoicomonas sp. Alg238-R29]
MTLFPTSTEIQTQELQLPPLSLYIHVPWCIRKCPYCDFNSHQADKAQNNEGHLPEQQYVRTLLNDLTQEAEIVQGRELHSIFIGGGTPSLLSPESYEQLFSGLKEQLTFSSGMEITMEANPGTFEQERFNGFRNVGINRLSIGIQSFDDKCLKELGRIHSGDEAQRAMAMARAAGFENINLDLMHGLPGQSEAMAMDDLAKAIALKPEHLSWYQLTVEPNTVFWTKPPKLPEDDTLWSIQENGQAFLAKHGYQQYEVSAYSQEGKQSRHNLNYWQFGDFIGIGAGAHGKITDLTTGTIRRNWKTRLPADYLNPEKSFLAGERLLEKDELPLEFMMNALRLRNGVATELYEQRTGLPLKDLESSLIKLRSLELMVNNPERIQPSEKGSLFLNELLEHFCS